MARRVLVVPDKFKGSVTAAQAAAAGLIWAVLGRLCIPGAFLTALVYAIHPLNVECVAWVAEQKSLLSMRDVPKRDHEVTPETAAGPAGDPLGFAFNLRFNVGRMMRAKKG